MKNNQNDWMTSLTSWLAFRLLQLLPIAMTSSIGAGLGQLYAFNADKRGHLWFKRLRSNMTLLSKGASQQEIQRDIYKCVRHSGRVMAEFAVIHRVIGTGRIKLRGKNNLQGLHSPVIIISPHLGNWETIGGMLGLQGLAITALYDPPQNETVHRLAVEARARVPSHQPGSKLIVASSRAARHLVRAAEQQENLLIFIDEMKDDLIWSPALGRQLPPYGNRILAARLAIKYGYKIVPVYAQRLRGARFEVIIERPIDVMKFGSDTIALADHIAEWTEKRVLEDLTQWYWLPELRMDRQLPKKLIS